MTKICRVEPRETPAGHRYCVYLEAVLCDQILRHAQDDK